MRAKAGFKGVGAGQAVVETAGKLINVQSEEQETILGDDSVGRSCGNIEQVL